MAITRQELIKKFIEFFKSKKHKEIPNSSLIPSNDPTVLFTTAGMHPLVPYLIGQPHPLGKRLVNVQRCIRTGDIDEVGDTTHHTFFEMLGNWSLEDYWKKEAISMTFEFHTKILKIPLEKYAVSCFAGDSDAERDEESEKTWLSLGIPKERIVFLPKKDNWWGPAGESGPCGPNTEMFYWKDNKKPAPKIFNPRDENWVEIGNDVFMQYQKIDAPPHLKRCGLIGARFLDARSVPHTKVCGFQTLRHEKILEPNSEFLDDRRADINKHDRHEKIKNKKFIALKQKNIDFGGGVERTLAVLNNLDDNYLTEIWQPIIKEMERISHKKYEDNKKEMRIIADHIKAATFIIGDENSITPANVGQGYVLRRLIRRAIRYSKLLNIKINFTSILAEKVIHIYNDYETLKKNKEIILKELEKEEIKFKSTLERGIRQFNKLAENQKEISGKESFLLFQSFGFPIEMTEEMAKEKNIKVNTKEFHEEYQKHQELSRTTSAGVFKSGLSDNSEKTTRLHTATHLLNEAMSRVLGPEVAQRGSNITQDRTRFDFTFSRKLTEEEIKKIEDIVNSIAKKNLVIKCEELEYKKAIESGAKGEFGHKYPERVSVYTVLDTEEKKGYFSREICTGPHVKNTKDIGKIKITEQSSVSAGVRRIKAIVEN